MDPAENNDAFIEKAKQLRKQWLSTAIVWRILDHVFAVGSFTASIAVVYIASEQANADSLIILLSSLAAILTLIGFACNPGKYMVSYRKAFDILNKSILIHENNQIESSDKNNDRIIDSILRGERFIAQTYGVDNDDCTSYNSDRSN